MTVNMLCALIDLLRSLYDDALVNGDTQGAGIVLDRLQDFARELDSMVGQPTTSQHVKVRLA
jgi:hypothetical protein